MGKDEEYNKGLPALSYSAILAEGEIEPLVEAGQPVRRDVLSALAGNINYKVDSTRLFKESPYVDNKSMVIIVRNSKAYVATASPQFPIRLVIGYLTEMLRAFEINPKLNPSSAATLEGKVKKIKNSEVQKHMKQLMENRMKYYSYDPEADKFRAIFKDVDEAKLTLHECIERLLVRQEEIERLEEKSTLLNQQAGRLKSLSNELSWKEYWKAKKCAIVGGCAAVLTTTVVITSVTAALI